MKIIKHFLQNITENISETGGLSLRLISIPIDGCLLNQWFVVSVGSARYVKVLGSLPAASVNVGVA